MGSTMDCCKGEESPGRASGAHFKLTYINTEPPIQAPNLTQSEHRKTLFAASNLTEDDRVNECTNIVMHETSPTATCTQAIVSVHHAQNGLTLDQASHPTLLDRETSNLCVSECVDINLDAKPIEPTLDGPNIGGAQTNSVVSEAHVTLLTESECVDINVQCQDRDDMPDTSALHLNGKELSARHNELIDLDVVYDICERYHNRRLSQAVSELATQLPFVEVTSLLVAKMVIMDLIKSKKLKHIQFIYDLDDDEMDTNNDTENLLSTFSSTTLDKLSAIF